MRRNQMARFTALLLMLMLLLTACSNATPEESGATPDETGAVTDTASPDESTGSAESPEISEDPEDPENLKVGDRDDTLTFTIEGVEETVNAVRHTSWLGYAMTYDPEVFTLTEEEDDTEQYQAEPVEGRPDVYVSVRVVEDMTAEEAVEEIRRQHDLEEEGETVSLGANRYAAVYLRWAEGAGSNDQVIEYYVTEQNGTIFLVEVGNFVDGAEGFGPRLQAMLDTLTF